MYVDLALEKLSYLQASFYVISGCQAITIYQYNNKAGHHPTICD